MKQRCLPSLEPVIRAAPKFCLPVVLLALLSGCCTSALWREKNYQAAENPQLRLFWTPATNDVLVQYAEQCGTNRTVETRCYWLFANTDSGTISSPRQKPDFVPANSCTNMYPVILQSETAGNDDDDFSTNSWSAVVLSDQHSFILWQNETNRGTYLLPAYRAAPLNQFWRVTLTPVAVAGDAVIVAAVLFAVGMSAGGL